MRPLALALVLILTPFGTAAQTLGQAPPLGAFRMGMSPQEVRNAVPGAQWEVVDDVDQRRGSLRSRGAILDMYGASFRAQLAYGANGVALIRLSAELALDPPQCATRHHAIVEAEMPTMGPFYGREYWHRFYQNPDGPTGRMDGDAFVPSPSTAMGAQVTTIANPALQYNSIIESFEAPDLAQAFQRASNLYVEMSAFSFLRFGAPVCQLVIQSADRRTSGHARLRDGAGGAERLAQRLVETGLVRQATYLTRPDPMSVTRFYPGRAMHEEVSGHVVMDCLILADGLLDCSLRTETPPEMGFGEAALRVALGYRVDVFADNAAGKRTQVAVRFRAPEG